MKHSIFAIAIAFLSFAANTQAASFNCAKASTWVEKAICSDSELSALDDSLMKAYKNALASTQDASRLKSEQRAWLKEVRNLCDEVNCLNRTLADRLKILSGMASPNTSARTSPTGTYYVQDSSDELKIQKISEKQIKFKVSVIYKMNDGEESGEAVLNGDTAIYENREENCQLSFKFVPSRVIVTQNGRCNMGFNVSASGTYILRNSNTPKFDSINETTRANSPPPVPQPATDTNTFIRMTFDDFILDKRTLIGKKVQLPAFGSLTGDTLYIVKKFGEMSIVYVDISLLPRPGRKMLLETCTPYCNLDLSGTVIPDGIGGVKISASQVEATKY